MFLVLASLLAILHFSWAACPNGWVVGPSNNYCYKAVNNATYWVDADYNCILQGGHLASVSDAFTNSFLNSEAKKAFGNGNATEFWLGSTTMIQDGQWSWSDGNEASYMNWASGQPGSNSGTNCAVQTLASGKWYNRDCYIGYRMPYFCEISQASTPCPTLPSFPQNDMRAGEWVYDQTAGKCYLLLSYSLAGRPLFDQGRTFCKEYGADDLVSIGSEQENERIGASIVPFSLSTDWFANDGAMIGLFNNGTGWKWVNGQPATYTNWLKTPNATDFGWVMFEYGYKEGHRNQWVLGGTFYYDGCAVLICEKVIK